MLKVKQDFDFLRAAVSACVKGEEEEEEEEGAELKHKSWQQKAWDKTALMLKMIDSEGTTVCGCNCTSWKCN